MSYKLTTNDEIIRLVDGAVIPASSQNGDYAAYLGWLAQGNVPEPADTTPPLTVKQRTDAICAARGVTREIVWAVILATEGAARATAVAMSIPEAIVLADVYARMKLYRECKEIEVACRTEETT